MRGARPAAGAGRRRPPGFTGMRAAAVLFAAALLAAAACGGRPVGERPVVLTTSKGGVTARLRMSPEPAHAMKPLHLSVALIDAGGRPAAGHHVVFDLSMPSMAMAPNRPEVTEVVAGTYEASAMLPMAGRWLLAVVVDPPGPRLELSFPFVAE